MAGKPSLEALGPDLGRPDLVEAIVDGRPKEAGGDARQWAADWNEQRSASSSSELGVVSRDLARLLPAPRDQRASFDDWKRRFQLEGLDSLKKLRPIAQRRQGTCVEGGDRSRWRRRDVRTPHQPLMEPAETRDTDGPHSSIRQFDPFVARGAPAQPCRQRGATAASPRSKRGGRGGASCGTAARGRRCGHGGECVSPASSRREEGDYRG